MLWMILICVLPLVVLLFAGGKLSSGGYLWPILIGAFIVAHLWMMFKGHGGHSDVDEDGETKTPKQPEIKNKYQHGGGCH